MNKLIIYFCLFVTLGCSSQELMNFYLEPNGTDIVTLHTVVYKNTFTSLGSFEVSFVDNTINVAICYLVTSGTSITVDPQENDINLPTGYSNYIINIELYGDGDAVPPCSLASLADTGTITFGYPYNPTATTFVPDNVFEDYLENLGFGDDLANNDFVLTHRVINNRHVFVNNQFIPLSGDILSMEGIQDFLALRHLRCSRNLITELDLSSNLFLEILFCFDNPISQLNISNSIDLYWLLADEMNLNTIDVTNNINLEILNVSMNNISTIDVTQNINLKELRLFGNQFENIDVTHNILLEGLFVGSNLLTAINLSNNPNLIELDTSFGNMNALDLSNNNLIEILSIRDCFFTSLDISNLTNLKGFDCFNNQITSLDFSSNPLIELIVVPSNNLAALNVKNGNNDNIELLYALDNDGLFCIDVDDPSAAPYPDWFVDSQVMFSEDCSLGQDDALAAEIAIFPNPAVDNLYIISKGISIEKLKVYSMSGQLLWTCENFTNSIDVSKLSDGIYFLEISTLNGKRIKKFVKE